MVTQSFNHKSPVSRSDSINHYHLPPSTFCKPFVDLVDHPPSSTAMSEPHQPPTNLPQPRSNFVFIQKCSKSYFKSTIVFVSTRRRLGIRHRCKKIAHAPSHAACSLACEIYSQPTRSHADDWRRRLDPTRHVTAYVIDYISDCVIATCLVNYTFSP